MKKLLLLTLALSSLLFASKQELTVSILPQKYFVQKIVGDKFDINVMVKKGFSPATYEPKTSQLKKLTQSKIYFSIGVPFENSWLAKFKNVAKNTLFVDTSKDINKIAMAKHTHHDEETNHKEHEEHEHSSLDPHIWLDPILVKTQAKNIYEAIIKLDSKNIKYYKKNYDTFISQLNILNSNIKTTLKPYKQKAFMVFHPSWGYFAKRYNLEQIAVEVEGKEPKLSQLKELIEEAKEHNIKIMFVSSQFSQKSAEQIAKNIKGKTATINPLSENWANNLIDIANKIANSYKH